MKRALLNKSSKRKKRKTEGREISTKWLLLRKPLSIFFACLSFFIFLYSSV